MGLMRRLAALALAAVVIPACGGGGSSGGGGGPSAPAAPTGLTATPGDTQNALSWTASAGAVSYNVYRHTASGGPYSLITNVAVTAHTDPGLVNGTPYFYVVRAVNAVGESGDSTEASATPLPPPPAPTGLAATAGNAQVDLTWNPSAGAVSYNVYRHTVSGGPYALITNVAVTTYTNTGLTNNTAYYFVVRAVNSAGESGNSNQASATPIPPPPAPTGLAATAGSTQVGLTWNASAGAVSYNVYRGTATTGPYGLVTNVGVTNYTNTGLSNGTTYYFVVRAVNGSGESGNSTEASATPIPPPSAPTGLSATWGNTQVDLSWSPSAGATSYNVYRHTASGGPYSLITNVAVTTYSNTGLSNGTSYYYVVRAANGSGESGNSTEVSGAPATVPSAPTGLVATAGNSQIGLSWAAGSPVTGHRIDRSLTSGGPYGILTSVAGTSHTDLGLSNGTAYYYVVRGVNGSVVGPASTEASATPVTGSGFNQAVGLDYQAWAVARATDASGDVYVGGELRSFGTTSIGGIVRLNSDGTRDTAFTMVRGTSPGYVRAIAPLASGGAIIGGDFLEYDSTTARRIAKLTSTGALDSAFGTGFDGMVNVILPDGSGKYYVGGAFTDYKGATANRLVRIDAAGVVDPTFLITSGFAAVGSAVHGLAIDGSGNLYVVGQFTDYNGTAGLSNIVRLTSTGGISPGFTATANGIVYAVAIASDGSLYFGGTFSLFNGASRSRIMRTDSTGAALWATGAAGGSPNADVLSLVADGTDVYACGLFTAKGATAVGRIVRLNDDGSLDAGFAAGTGFNSDARAIIPDGSGGLYAVGLFTAFNGVGVDRLTRVNSSGVIVGMPIGAGFQHAAQALAFVPSTTDVYVGGIFTHYNGEFHRGLVRLNDDGSVDPTLVTDAGFIGGINALLVAGDGDLYVGGGFSSYKTIPVSPLIRLDPTGARDTAFAFTTGFDGNVNALAAGPSGSIYVAGMFQNYNGTPAGRIVRLTSTGGIDPGFTMGAGFNNVVNALAVDGSGNVYAGGQFTSYAGTTVNRFARLTSAGALDATFTTTMGTAFNSLVNVIALDGSGKIYVAGDFTTYNTSSACPKIARLNSDGTFDGTFIVGNGFNNAPSALAPTPGGEVYVGGSITSYKLTAIRPLVRLTSNGTLDPTFPGATSTYSPGMVQTLGLLPDASGRLYMGGNITTWAGTTMDFFARLTASGAVE